MCLLLLICFLLIKTRISCKSALRLYLVGLCLMAFFYKPYITADLYRVYMSMDFFATMDIKTFLHEIVMDRSNPAAKMLYWCIGKTGIRSLLPAFSAFVCYYLLFYVITKTSKIYSISNKNVACVLFFVMTTSMYISVIGGIRMMMALSMITFSFFRGTVEKKITVIDIFLYVLSLFIHLMSPICLGICVLTFLLDSHKKIARRIGYLFVTGAAVVFFAVCFSNTTRDIMGELYQGFVEYVLGDKYSDFWEYIMGALIIMTLLILFKEFRHVRQKNDYKRICNYNLAAIICVIIALCFCFEFSIFYRFGAQLAVIFAIPSMMVTLENTDGRSSAVIKRIDFRSIIIILSILIAAISCSRGSLSSLKFFEL